MNALVLFDFQFYYSCTPPKLYVDLWWSRSQRDLSSGSSLTVQI